MSIATYIIEYKDIFDDQKEPFTSYLQGIGKKDTIILSSAFISNCLFAQNSVSVQNQINNWFSSPNEELKKAVLLKISEIKHKSKIFIHIFNVLKILEYIIKNGAENSTLSNAEIEVKYLKAILALNQEFNQRDEVIENSLAELGTYLKFHCSLLTTAFCYFDLNYFKLNEQELSQFIKSSFLFDFIGNYSDTTRAILNDFYTKSGVSSWKDYLNKLSPKCPVPNTRSYAIAGLEGC